MGYERLIKSNYDDMNNLVDTLKKLTESYRLLIGGAAELNTISRAKKSDVEDALDRVDDLGEIIDELIEVIEKSSENYLKYCKIKNELIGLNIQKDMIETEIDEELEFKN